MPSERSSGKPTTRRYSVEEVELATLGWVHWHNTERLHGYLGDLPHVEFEALHAPEDKPNTQDPGDQSVTDTAARAAERLPAPQPEALELEITADAGSQDAEQRTRPPWPPTPPGAVAIICGNPATGINRTPRHPKRTG